MTPQPASESDELAKLRRENAAWRRKFREAEDALRAQADEVRRYQHAELERVATELRFHDAADALGFLDRQELFGDGGRIDVEKAKRALSSLASSKPCLVQPEPEPESPREQRPAWPDVHGGPRQPEPPKPPSFGELLKGS